MNEDANDPDEFIEAAPEDDDFSDYEAAENENPEAVQAMIGGPSWIFPDLVQRVQSSPPAGNADANLSEHQQQQLQSRSSPAAAAASDLTASTCQPSTSRGSVPRALDPPDVSLLTCPGNANSNCSASSSSTQQQHQQQPNTIDLCNSIRQGSKLNFSSSGYISAASKNGGGSSNHSATSSPPSNSVGSSSSSSGASSLSTNISGLVLSSTSSLSSSAAAANGALMNNGVHRGSADNSDAFPDFNLPSTSAASTQKQLNSMEREIRVLEEEKAQLAQQLVRKDDELEEMRQSLSSMRLSSNGTTAATAPANSSPPTEGAIVRRIEHLFEQMSANIQNSLAAFERRIESLESRQMLHASSGGASSSLHPPPSSSPQQLAQLMAECQRRINENQRQEMCSLFRNILTSAVGEIDSFSSLAPSASSSSSSSTTTATTTTSESLLQQRQNGKFKSNLNGL